MVAEVPALLGRSVFISYPRGGRCHSVAEQLEQALQHAGAKVFRDEMGVRPGSPDAIGDIEQALSNADVLVYVHGADSAVCAWQRREVLWALRDGLPRVVAQTDASSLALELIDTQPVDARSPTLANWLPALITAVAAARRQVPRFAPGVAATPLHQASRAYVLHGLSSDWSDRMERYVPLAGQHQRSRQPQARRKKLLHDSTLLLTLAQDMGLPTRSHDEAKAFRDVLALYQHLLGQRARPRLAVLGEPGAGKSFSLQRLFCALAQAHLDESSAPIPVLLALGDWTRADMSLEGFIDHQLKPWGLQAHWRPARDQGQVVLLLDGLNEIPVTQRISKVAQVFEQLQDQRWAAVLLSCRERDFAQRPLNLPLDQVSLAPLDEAQIQEFLQRWVALDGEPGDPHLQQRAEQLFWRLAAGPQAAEAAHQTWLTWQAAGATWQQFWSCQDLPGELPAVHQKTSGEQDQLWRRIRFDERSLLRLARSPYWLELLLSLDEQVDLPPERVRLFALFLKACHGQGEQRCAQRHALGEVPALEEWLLLLQRLAMDLQRVGSAPQGFNPQADGAQTRLARDECRYLTDQSLEFGVAVQVLKESRGQVSFAHQLMQETLAAQGLLGMVLQGRTTPPPSPSWFWPADAWWVRNGWEVVAELVAETLASLPKEGLRLVAWLAQAQPEAAARAWMAAGRPTLPSDMAATIQAQWLPRLTTEAQAMPEARLQARAALGRGLGLLGLDTRPGVGLRADGLPDIDWERIADTQPFVYQGQPHSPLPAFELARYPVTHVQFEAFVDDGGYAPNAPWWQGLAQRFEAPAEAAWAEPNSPREGVSWLEAVAFCRWLSHRMGQAIRLPTEHEWERAAAGREGRAYPWGRAWDATRANAEYRLGRTCAVGLLPEGASLEERIHDLSGQVWEWCLNEYREPDRVQAGGEAGRVLRGGAWYDGADGARASYRFNGPPGIRLNFVGFRVCRASPI